MTIFFSVLLLFGGTWLCGWWIGTVFEKKDGWEKVGLAGLFGSLWLTVTSFLLHVFIDIPFSKEIVLISLLAGLLIFAQIVILQKKKLFALHFIPSSRKKVESFVLLILLLLLPPLMSFIQNNIWPISDWDSLALYDFRAKVLLIDGNWKLGNQLGYFFQYPPYTSLLHAAAYVFGIQQAKIWYSLIYSSFLLTFYALLRKETTRFWSIVGTILVTYSPLMIEHSTVAYTNLSYSVFLILGIMYFWRSLKTDGTRSEASIGFFFVSASLWVRLSEPFWLVGIVLLGFFGYRKKDWLFSIVASLGLLFARRSWSFLVKYIIRGTEIVAENDVQTVVETPKTILQHIQTYVPLHYFAALLVPLSIHFQHIQQVISYLLAYVWPLFNYIFIPWLLITWYDIKKKNFYRLFCINGTIIGILATIFAGTYVFSFFFETWDQIGGSATRMSMFIVPLIWYYLMSSQIWIEIQNTYVKKNRN